MYLFVILRVVAEFGKEIINPKVILPYYTKHEVRDEY